MIFFFAGGKPEAPKHRWDDPRVAAGKELDVMTTFWELKRMNPKKVREFIRTLGRKKGIK